LVGTLAWQILGQEIGHFGYAMLDAGKNGYAWICPEECPI